MPETQKPQKLPLSKTHPQIAQQWHRTKNGDLSAKDVSAGSGKKVWWQCSQDKTHIWTAVIGDRTRRGPSCPFCVGQRVCVSNALSTTHPKLAKEWHSTKNVDLKPTDVNAGSGKKVWWQCPRDKTHIWAAVIEKRARQGRNCPFCVGQKVCTSNALSTTHPKLAKEWHATKNGALQPSQVTRGTARKVWWQCKLNSNHFWQATIVSRSNGTNCPYCSHRILCSDNSLSALFPDIAAQWHPTKNGKLKPSEILAGARTKAWWQCPKSKYHTWQTPISIRTSNERGCPFCAGQRATPDNNLKVNYPLVAQQWHPTHNGSLGPTDVKAGSGKKVWWRCLASPKHVWQAIVSNVVAARRDRLTTGCPFCAEKERNLNLKLGRTARNRASFKG